ncbi:integrase core domain protein [Holospora obtusa F1]|uniref:Integrase core domain protein n=1 Tax=Holospora obtusa F1 TaxID=1399147 RepID=W6TGJ3_HOLOB|nr:integrase core domain protein [Holospora obtusa F1]
MKPLKNILLDLFILTVQKVLTNQGKFYLFVAIDRATKYVHVELHSKMSVNESSAFLKNLISHCPFKITKILTDNGVKFTYGLLALHLRPKNKTHLFDVMCKENRTQAYQIQASLDQRSGRSHQQNLQTLHNKGVFLQRPR